MNAAIKVENLQKKYSNKPVLKGITFDVIRGEIFALLGMNGAGKTTTLECIEGLRKYDDGAISINGKIGVQLQSSTLPANIKAKEALRLFSKWASDKKETEMQDFLIKDISEKRYKEMSTGQKRRLHLALALVGNPDIIILDEPTAGLDVEGRAILHEKMRELKNQGKTLIMASHDMAEVEMLCDRIAIIKDGKIIFSGTASELTAHAVEGEIKIHLKSSVPLPNDILTHNKEIGQFQGYYVYSTRNLEDGLLELINTAKTNSIKIYDLQIEHANLEERFLELAKER